VGVSEGVSVFVWGARGWCSRPRWSLTLPLTRTRATGKHDVTLAFAGTGKVDYNLVAQYNVPWANAPGTPGGPLGISVSYDKTSLVLDETATATVVVKNNTASTQNMILVTLRVWTEGVQLMVEGEKTRFWIPGKMAYGDEPGPPGRPSGMLVFDIELIEIKK
jgi:hypothetical protein